MKTYFDDEVTETNKTPFSPCMIVVQARMKSTRLPGKVLKTVLGKPLLAYLIERLRRVRGVEGIVIATSKNPADDVICDFCNHESLHFIRGSEEDVLSRYEAASDAFGLDVIVRVTSDCPLFDPELLDIGLSYFRKDYNDLDYLSNCLHRTYPRGMDFEIFRESALKSAFFEAKDSAEKEHVTPFIYRQPERFRLGNLQERRDLSHFRLTVDTPEDFELISRIITELYPQKPEFSLADIMQTLQKHPDWAEINASIRQKEVG